MNTRPPPRYVVQPLDSQAVRRRRWLWLALIWAVSLVVVAAAVYLAVDRGPLASPDRTNERQLNSDNDALRQQVATLTRSEQVARVAADALKDTLADREEEISGLRADLAFYSRLVGGGAQREGLQLQGVHVQQVDRSRAWNFTITLTQNAKRGEETRGTLKVAVEGVRGDKLVRLDGSVIGGPAQKDGLTFAFKYFQQIHGTLMLPADFTPNRLRIAIAPQRGKAIDSTVAWAQALKPVEESHVQP
jgi:hypothetical protein